MQNGVNEGQQRRLPFRVPKNLRSVTWRHEYEVMFKNISDTEVLLYWINYSGFPELKKIMPPAGRCDEGFSVTTFASHPWVAVTHNKQQLLLNGRRYYFPPNPNKSTNKVYQKWLAREVNESELSCYEVLIQMPGVSSLRTLCLLGCCRLYENCNHADLQDIPRHLREDIDITRLKYFYS